ncbi:ABC transporter substrate-binding protein [Enterococcus sp. AZ163]|uniref:ABC transporter substrate-binding protein n=1 Tax=Enterococcus sp. AZ163 TaxID=2774638 RepID=UPI003D2E97E3
MKVKWRALVALSSLLVLGACSNEQSATENKELEKITFVLDWTPNTNHTGLYVAQQKGYFEEEGLDVEIVQPSDGDASAIVASGKAQFGISAQDSLAPSYASDDSLPITAVATILQHNTSGIMSLKGEGIDRPKGLEGKTYATWDSPVEQATIANVMEKDGGDFEKVNLIPNNIVDEPMALKEKQADAIWVFYGWGGVSAESEGVPIDYFYFKDLNPVFDYYTPVIISNDNFLKEHGDVAKKFLKAAEKGYEFAIESPEEAADILVEEAPELNKDLVLASQKWLSEQYRADEDRWGYIDSQRWNDFYTWLGKNQLIDKEIPENTGFTNDYLPSEQND